MTKETDKLLARADAAIAEARRLVVLNDTWQDNTSHRLHLMFSRFAAFKAIGQRARYPQDLHEQQPPAVG